MATYDARRVPGPPPEEAEEVPVRENEQQAMARRLSAAFNREEALRCIRVSDQAARIKGASEAESWMKLARSLLHAGIVDPERFMHAAFTQSIPRDNTLMFGPASNNFFDGPSLTNQIDNYRRFCERADRYLVEDWEHNARVFELAITGLRDRFPEKPAKSLWNYAVLSGRYDMSPLFKYVLLMSEQMYEDAARFHDEALLQLLGDPQGYLRAWKGKLPTALIEEAEDVLNTTLGDHDG